ncbi:NBS-containing resistance-like protein, partial [Trifolium pratense]
MDCKTLIDQVIQFLESKRYLLLFDDVWTENFSDDIEHALINNNKGSRIIVTTRMMPVAEYFKKSFTVHIHELQFLPKEKARELFRKKAFRSHPENQCPKDLVKMSNEIVKKCEGLPLAIVAIGGLLSTKTKTIEWEKDYTINRKRITRQWMAEGFVRYEKRRTLEDVAEEYLTELIQRSLVNVSRIGFDGKVKSCQVHDMLHEVIIKKMEDLSFCHLIRKDDEQVTVGITRRFSIAAVSNNALRNNRNEGIRAIFVFDKGEFPKHVMDGLSSKFKLLKVLDFENSRLNSIPDNLGNLFHLRYLNLSHTKVTVLPKSIGMLVNLETLDLRQTKVHELPKEIKKLTKLRLLPVYYRKYEGQYSMLNFTDGLKMQKGIGSLISLQKLYFLEAADHGGVDLIRELEKLIQLRKLGIKRVRQGHANALCAAIQKMKHLESLNIGAKDKDETLDLDFLSTPPPNLRVLNLK